ncbi:tyrosine recombinase XerC, partial [Lacisediminimonas sp.]|uniref:site-specific integrase n=1 Tax=Lacisediminimonas sp. TaxID=3060582 RepID=UPI0027285518
VIPANPATGIPRAKHQKEPPDPFTADERDGIVAALQAKHPDQPANFVEFWFWTGLRTSEIFALRWSNVDLASGTMLVSEATVRGKTKGTKTATARTVILNSRAKAALARQRPFTQVAGDRVFNDPRYGAPWSDERAFRRSYWTPTLKVLGIRYRRPYNMRHTYATVMLMAGMTPAFCARQLGHSIEMFLRTYSKWLDGAQNDLEMARLERSLDNPGDNPGIIAGKSGE